MKKAIAYYSTTGNTKLVCQSIEDIYPDFKLLDITKQEIKNLNDYDLVGFASSVSNLDIPPIYLDYISSLDQVGNKPAF